MPETLGAKARSLNLRAHLGANRHADSLATWYFALLNAHPLEGGIEPVQGTGGYGRATVSNGAAMWGAPSMSTLSVTSLQPIVWPAATALWSITTPLTHWAVYSATTAGDLWYIGLCEEPKIVANVGDQPRILAGGLIITQG